MNFRDRAPWLGAKNKSKKENRGLIGWTWNLVKAVTLTLPVVAVIWLLDRQKIQEEEQAGERIQLRPEPRMPVAEPVVTRAPVESPPPTQTSAPVAPEGQAEPQATPVDAQEAGMVDTAGPVQVESDEMAQAEARQEAAAPVTGPAEAQPAAPKPPEAKKLDNLARIEGIGPKVKALLQEAGYVTFADLAAAEPDDLRQLLAANNLYMIDPSTWPQQAGLLAEGKEEDFEALKEELRGGRRGA